MWEKNSIEIFFFSTWACVRVSVGCLRILFINSRGPVSLVIFTVYAHPNAYTTNGILFSDSENQKPMFTTDVFVVLAAAAVVQHWMLRLNFPNGWQHTVDPKLQWLDWVGDRTNSHSFYISIFLLSSILNDDRMKCRIIVLKLICKTH